MKRNTLKPAILILALVAASGTAFGDGPSVARLVMFSAKPGSKAPLEEAIKNQMDWRRGQKDPWRWLTWEYASGGVPRYCVATFGHAWSEYDQVLESRAEESFGAAAAALSSTPPSVQYFEHLAEVSDFGTQTNTPALAEISIYQLHYGKTGQFYAALRQFHDALSRGGGGNRYEWFELRSGGDTPQFMLMVPRANWAAFDTNPGLLAERLEEQLGKEKASQLIAEFTAAVKSHHRSAVRLRPDLSLLPPPKNP